MKDMNKNMLWVVVVALLMTGCYVGPESVRACGDTCRSTGGSVAKVTYSECVCQSVQSVEKKQ